MSESCKIYKLNRFSQFDKFQKIIFHTQELIHGIYLHRALCKVYSYHCNAFAAFFYTLKEHVGNICVHLTSTFIRNICEVSHIGIITYNINNLEQV